MGRVALSRLLNGATGISPEMALRLPKALSTSPEFWYGMQVNYDLRQAKKKFRGKVRPIVQRTHLSVTKRAKSLNTLKNHVGLQTGL